MTAPTALARAERWLSPAKVATALRYQRRTVQVWCETGRIPATQSPTGRWMIPSAWLAEGLHRLGAVVRRK